MPPSRPDAKVAKKAGKVKVEKSTIDRLFVLSVISVNSVAKNLRPEFNEANELATELTEQVNTTQAEPRMDADARRYEVRPPVVFHLR